YFSSSWISEAASGGGRLPPECGSAATNTVYQLPVHRSEAAARSTCGSRSAIVTARSWITNPPGARRRICAAVSGGGGGSAGPLIQYRARAPYRGGPRSLG